ncbi:MAG: DUF1800 family protein [Kofleriaceae bacterium]
MLKIHVVLAMVAAGAACGEEATLSLGTEEATAPLQEADALAEGSLAALATTAEAIRFLEQASFGPRPQTINRVRTLGIPAFLDEQLAAPSGQYAPTPAHVPPTPCNAAFPADTDLDAQFYVAAINGGDQLRQRVMFALSQILVISANGINENQNTCNSERRDAMQRYLNVLRRGAFGSYRELLEAIALEPAMGNYLDMVNNVAFDRNGNKLDPNENFARELMQLFTVGTNRLNEQGAVLLSNGEPIPVYDEVDVEEFSRALTGWTYPHPDGCPTARGGKRPAAYNARMIGCAINHDSTSARLLRYATASKTRTTGGASPRAHLEEVLDNLFQHPNLPPFVVKQLIHHLVTSNPSGAYVRRVVQVFKDDGAGNRGNLGAVVRAILLDPEARTAGGATYGRLRAPAEFITRVVRSLGGTLDTTANDPGGALNTYGSRMGQDVPRPPSVFSYFQAQSQLVGPEFALLDSYTATKRAEFVHQLAFGTSLANRGVSISLAMNEGTPQLLSWLDTNLLHGTMSPTLRSTLTGVLNDGFFTSRPAQKRAMAVYLTSLSPEFQIQR